MAIPVESVAFDRAVPVAVPSPRARSERRLAALLLLPSVGFLLVMTIFPTIYSLWMSMQQYNLSRPDLAHFVGMRNYVQLVHDDIFWKAVRVTLIFSAAVLTIEFKINLLAPARGPRFRVEGTVVKPGRTITVVEGRAWQIEGGAEQPRLVATMSATVMTVVGRDIRD